MTPELLLSLAQACAATYVDGAKPTFENPLRLCHVYHSLVDGVDTFAFEGTTDLAEWIVDFFALKVPVIHDPNMGLVHEGFLLDVQSVQGFIQGMLHAQGWPKFYNTGHSKGAGEAILCSALFAAMGHPPAACAAFEPPRVGGLKLSDLLHKAAVDILWTQTMNRDGKDVITLVPFGLGWTSIGKRVELSVPDIYDVAQRHRIPAVIEALLARSPALTAMAVVDKNLSSWKDGQ